MSSTKHRNLVGLVGVSGDHTHRILVLPLADGGDLNAAMDRGMSGNAMLQVLADASRGLSYMLHELPTAILHLDVKPGNILIDKGRGLIADFGLCVLETGLADKASFCQLWTWGCHGQAGHEVTCDSWQERDTGIYRPRARPEGRIFHGVTPFGRLLIRRGAVRGC